MADQTVLFVDDEVEILEILQEIFCKSQFDVLCVSTGEEAIKLLSKKNVNVIVCDLMLNDISGLEVLTQYKKKSPDTYRILMTGYLDDEHQHNIMKKEIVQNKISKPWDIFQMHKNIENLMKGFRFNGGIQNVQSR